MKDAFAAMPDAQAYWLEKRARAMAEKAMTPSTYQTGIGA